MRDFNFKDLTIQAPQAGLLFGRSSLA